MKYKAICGELYGRPLLILPQKADEIRWFIERRGAGVASEQKNFATQPQPYLTTEQVAIVPTEAVGNSSAGKFVGVLPLFGTLFQHGDMAMDASGGTSTVQFTDQFSRLLAQPSIKSIVIEVHSPGGHVWGTQEAADVIYAARQSGKRVVSMVNSMAASAALWIATAAQEMVITPGGEAGSIGVVVLHEDISGAEAKAGIKTTLIAYPEKKIAGHPYAPLEDEARRDIEGQIKGTYQRFVAGIARNRGVSPSAVESRFGGGGMLRAEQAVAVGLADRVATKHQVLSKEIRSLGSDSEQRKSVRNRIALAQLGGEF